VAAGSRTISRRGLRRQLVKHQATRRVLHKVARFVCFGGISSVERLWTGDTGSVDRLCVTYTLAIPSETGGSLRTEQQQTLTRILRLGTCRARVAGVFADALVTLTRA
jgi:hypothetical protein